MAWAIEGLTQARRDGARAEAWTPESYKEQPLLEQLNHAAVHVYSAQAGAKDEDHLAHLICRAVMALAVSGREWR